VTGPCPGLKLEKLHVKEFKRSAITFSGCAGERDQPIHVHQLRTTTGRKKLRICALNFKVDPGKDANASNRYITVSDCRFEGLYRSVVQLEGPVAFVSFVRNRFYMYRKGDRGEGVAFLYKGTEPVPELRLTIASNTFLRFNTCLHLPRLVPVGADSGVELSRNLFLSPTTLVSSDGPESEASWKPLLRNCVGNVSRGKSEPGVCPEPALALEFEDLSENTEDDNLFLRYPKTSPLFKAGPGNTPVGVPPPG
jgi:hypothetical protein